MSKLKFDVPCSKLKDCIEDVEIPYSSEEISKFIRTNNYKKYSKKANGIVIPSAILVLENI